jgi:hypothetical protein
MKLETIAHKILFLTSKGKKKEISFMPRGIVSKTEKTELLLNTERLRKIRKDAGAFESFFSPETLSELEKQKAFSEHRKAQENLILEYIKTMDNAKVQRISQVIKQIEQATLHADQVLDI